MGAAEDRRLWRERVAGQGQNTVFLSIVEWTCKIRKFAKLGGLNCLEYNNSSQNLVEQTHIFPELKYFALLTGLDCNNYSGPDFFKFNALQTLAV